MGVRYRVLIADELMDSIEQSWPDGLRPISLDPVSPAAGAGMHWWVLEDDNAIAELEGKQVELTLGWADGRTVITDRQVAA